MTTLRLLVLLLMAVLLPLRGTLAATQPCMGAGGGTSAAVVQAAPGGHGGAHHPDHHANLHAGHHQAHADDAGTSVDADTVSHGTGCQASACCLMPLAAAPPATAALRLDNQLRFPALVTPEPAFQCGGQDRPPRRG